MATVPDASFPVADAANRLAALGVSVIPIQVRTKEPPAGFKWGEYATRLADASERYTWFVERGYQIAVVAGAISGHLVPLDYDGTGGFECHAAQYPILRRYPRVETGSGKTHVWIRVAKPTQKYDLRLTDGSKLEVRANTHYTVCPPSIHPSGQPYRWIIDPWQGIPVIDLATIGLQHRAPREPELGVEHEEGKPLTDEEHETIIRLVTPHYLPDHRHELCLTIAGWLANLDVPEASARTIVDHLARDHGDTGRQAEYRRAVRDTYRKARGGIAVAGWARLTDSADPLVSPATAKQLDLLLRARAPQWTFEPGKRTGTNEPPTSGTFGRMAGGIELDALQMKEFAPLKWVIEGMLPEGALLLCGKSKARKSWLALQIALCSRMGTPVLGGLKTLQGRVLYLDLEGNQRRIQDRVAAILGRTHTPWPAGFHLFTAGEWPEGDGAFAQLQQWFKDYPDTLVAVIDVLQDFRPPIKKGENPYDYDRNVLKALNKLAEDNHALIVIIHHTRKAKGEDAVDEVNGTMGASSAVATLWVMSRGNEDNQTVLRQRGRDLRHEDDLMLRWDVLSAMHVIEGPAQQLNMSEERKAILDVLADDLPHTLSEIAVLVGKSKPAVSNRLAGMLADGQVDKVGHGQYARVVRERRERRE